MVDVDAPASYRNYRLSVHERRGGLEPSPPYATAISPNVVPFPVLAYRCIPFSEGGCPVNSIPKQGMSRRVDVVPRSVIQAYPSKAVLKRSYLRIPAIQQHPSIPVLEVILSVLSHDPEAITERRQGIEKVVAPTLTRRYFCSCAPFT